MRTFITCGVCIHVAGTLGAEAAAFPLLITAMTIHARGRASAKQVASQLSSHAISTAAATLVGLMSLNLGEPEEGDATATLLLGCLLLLSLQFTRVRHPPAMASGGAVLCGLDPVAVLSCVVITGAVLFSELLVLRVRGLLSCQRQRLTQ